MKNPPISVRQNAVRRHAIGFVLVCLMICCLGCPSRKQPAASGGSTPKLTNQQPRDNQDNSNASAKIVFKPAKLRPFDPKTVEVDPTLKVKVVRDELLVTMHTNHGRNELLQILKLVDPTAKIVGEIPMVNMFQVQLDAATKRGTQQKLENHPMVASVGLNVVRYSMRDYNDTFLNNDKKIDDWGIQKIDAPQAWDIATGKGTTIAVVDSGTLTTHEEMNGKTTDTWSYATNSDQNMYLKFLDISSGSQSYVAGHGTHVAITAAGLGDNGKGTVGIAPDAKVNPIQVLYFQPDGSQANGPRGFVSGSSAEVVAGITRAISNNVDVVNLSLGRGWGRTVKEEYWNATPAKRLQMEKDIFIPARDNDLKAYKKVIDLAIKQNVILVNAAGNDQLPARLDAFCFSDRMISVAATMPDDKRATFSNYGSKAVVSAPGFEIYSGYSSGTSAYLPMPGTSMASPHVAGVVALMREVYPKMTFKEAKEILIKTGRKLATDLPVGPLVNAAAAVAEAKKIADKNSPSPPNDPPMIEEPKPVDPPAETPAPKPSPEEMVNGPNPWDNVDIQNLIDLWLSIATPTIDPVDGRPWFYDEWGRALNNYSAWSNYNPDHGSMTRHQYVWQFAKTLDSTRHGTLYEFVLGMLRDGNFRPAPPTIPGPPKPNPPKKGGVANPGKPGTKPNPVAGGELPTTPASPFVLANLRGQWAGINSQEKSQSLGLNFFDAKTAWIVRNGDPTVYNWRIDATKTPTQLVLSKDGKDKVFVALDQLSGNSMKACTYHSRSRPRFREGDKRYTYSLKRINSNPGDRNPVRFGFSKGNIKLRSTETLVIGSESQRQILGTGFSMKPGYQVVNHDVSQDGKTIWMVIDNRYPAKGTSREKQIWCYSVDTGIAKRSTLDLSKHGSTHLKSTPDGRNCWLTADTSHPRAVQPRREIQIFRASVGQPFRLIADTDKHKDVGSLGLAQGYQMNVAADGNSILFVDSSNIWRVGVDGNFSKVIDREGMSKGSLKVRGYNGFKYLKLSRGGSTWVATLILTRGKKGVTCLIRGDLNGNASVIAESSSISIPRVSSDGKRVSFYDGTKSNTKYGLAGSLKDLKTEGKWHAFGTEFVNRGRQSYSVLGSYYTSGQAAGFMEDSKTGKRTITHSDQLIGPSPKSMLFSADGDRMFGRRNWEGITMVDLKPVNNLGVKIEEAIFKLENGRLYARFRVDRPKEIQQMKITALYQGYVPIGKVKKYNEHAFQSWGSYASMRPSKLDPNYFESYTSTRTNLEKALPETQFFVTIQTKDRARVSNYLVTFDQ